MTDAFLVTIFHNPDCGTSRNTVAMVRAAGYEPEIVEYLQAGWTRPQLEQLLAAMGRTARDLLRESGTPAAELGLLDAGAAQDTILDAMVPHPILVNRPIVATPKGAVMLTRPSERVFDLLQQRPERFTKEDGDIVSLD
jgi:arsenate reductase